MHAFTWKNLELYHCKYLDISIPRKPEVLHQYECDIYNGTCHANLEKIKESLRVNKFLIRDNLYPYNIESSIQHFLFWFEKNYTIEEALEVAKMYLKTDNILIMCNIQSLKSVIDIEHYHLFVLNV